MQLINLAQRSAAGKVVSLYYIKSGATPGEFRRRLAIGRDGLIVGKVEMTVDGEKMTCQLLAVNGRLFSLEFDQVPSRWSWRPRIRIDAVNVLKRPLKPRPQELRDFLPYDYAEVAARGEALPDNVTLFSLDEVYASTCEEGRFWLYGEIRDIGLLGSKADEGDRRVSLLFYDGRRSLELGHSLRQALERIRESKSASN